MNYIYIYDNKIDKLDEIDYSKDIIISFKEGFRNIIKPSANNIQLNEIKVEDNNIIISNIKNIKSTRDFKSLKYIYDCNLKIEVPEYIHVEFLPFKSQYDLKVEYDIIPCIYSEKNFNSFILKNFKIIIENLGEKIENNVIPINTNLVKIVFLYKCIGNKSMKFDNDIYIIRNNSFFQTLD